MRIFTICLALLISTSSNAQVREGNLLDNALKEFDFLEQKIIDGSDTITYYLKNHKGTKPTKLIVFIQGTDANPLFSYKMKEGKPEFYRWFNDDFKNIDSTSTYAIIPKPGMEGLYADGDIVIPEIYYQNNYKDYRVNQVHRSIEHIAANHLKSVDKVIVYGHSEGAAIGSALALINDKITHLGFWSGNVLNNFYEFGLFSRIESLGGQISDSLAHENIMGIMQWYEGVVTNPESTEKDHFGFTNKRWSSYEKPPIDELLEIDIPIYTMFGTEDVSTPIETAYLIPIQFIENRKSNLSFNVCLNCDHSYRERKGETDISHWDEIFKQFIKWTNKQ